MPAIRQVTVLGFDYGEKRLGVAVGQTITHTASPLQTIRVSNREPDWEAIARLVRQFEPRLFVVGLPVSTDGTTHRLAGPVHRFRDQLRQRYSLPVHLIDERLSSHEAGARLRRGRDDLDAVAAQVILETWLNENRT
ncbi:MAG: Holliday junction resolvase RuvX [Chromatiales bacterium]